MRKKRTRMKRRLHLDPLALKSEMRTSTKYTLHQMRGTEGVRRRSKINTQLQLENLKERSCRRPRKR
jgi:hypothetical protein